MAVSQFVAGMQNVERAIIDGVRKAGLHIDAKNVRWQHGLSFLPIPEAITLEVATNGHKFEATLSRQQLEDSWERIDRGDVHAMVDQAITQLVA